ncbi:MAG: PorT family protein [Bacteroidales bacterium]|nr:PorT family protein [Bacteroidales bacterium]
MRYIFVITIFLLSVQSRLMAQSFKSTISAGIVGSQVDGDNLGGYDKIGIYAGLGVRYPLSANIDLGMQISFIQKGSRQNADPANGLYDAYLMRLNYAEIPVFIQGKISKKVYFLAGPTLGYLISAIEKDNYSVVTQPSSVPPFRKFEIGILGAFGYQVNDKWSVVVRGQYSMIPIRKTPIIQLWYYNDSLKNNVLVFVLNYHFN